MHWYVILFDNIIGKIYNALYTIKRSKHIHFQVNDSARTLGLE